VNTRSLVTLAVLGGLWCAPMVAQEMPVRQGLVSLEDGRLFYEVVGAGDPIIVVHGGPGLDHSYLRPGLDMLASAHSLVYYDQRGTGRSDFPLDSASINLAKFVSDIDDLRQVLGYERVTVLGHSFGGLIALAYARAHPDHVTALILMDTAEPGERWQTEASRRAKAARTSEDSAELSRLLASPGYAAHDAATLSEIYRLSFRSTFLDPSRIDELNLKLAPKTAHDGQEVARLLGGDMAHLDWWPDLPSLTVPSLVIQGKADPMPLAMAKALAGAIPNAKLAVLDSGHFPEIEDPTGLVAAVSNFLAQLVG
jgi:proline iminopeptidase